MRKRKLMASGLAVMALAQTGCLKQVLADPAQAQAILTGYLANVASWLPWYAANVAPLLGQ